MRDPAQNRIKIDSEAFRQKLKVKHLEAKSRFKEKYPEVHKFFSEKGIDPGKIREHSAKIIGAGILTGSLVLTTPSQQKALPSPQEIVAQKDESDVNGDIP